MLKYEKADIDQLSDEEFEKVEQLVARVTSVWKIKNLRGNKAIFHDDQHIGEKRRELSAMKHRGVDVEELLKFRMSPVVDSLEGNMLIHPLTTPIVEVDESNSKARAVWWSIGIEGLSTQRETPVALVSVGMVPGAHIVEDDEWKILWGTWQRTTKNEYHTGWVHSMLPTVTRPPLTMEEDRKRLGKYAYRKNEVRKPVPEPPRKNTWQEFPDEMDQSWMTLNIDED
ncbi:MAG: hypothetical protein ACRC3H_05750 [Lachnospiraceae bacterium]